MRLKKILFPIISRINTIFVKNYLMPGKTFLLTTARLLLTAYFFCSSFLKYFLKFQVNVNM